MISLPQLRGNYRLGVWCLLCLLTLLVFLFPADLHYQYAPIQSIYAFHNLPLFGVLYYAWFALILVLLLFPGRKQGSRDWENIALVAIFALVFSGFWVNLSQGDLGAETPANASAIKYALPEGRMLSYLASQMQIVEFPGVPLLGYYLSQIAGLGIFDAITLLLLFWILLLSALLFILFRNLLGNVTLASLGTLFIISGSLPLADFLVQFHSRTFGLVLLVTCLIVATRDKPAMLRSWQASLLFLILLAAIIITHAVTTFVLFLILLGIYLVQRWSKANLVSLSLVVLTLASFLAHEVYIARGVFTFVARAAGEGIRLIFQGELVSFLTVRTVTGNLGAEVPLWARIVTSFWLVLIVLGGCLGFRNLLRVRRLGNAEKTVVGGLVGMALFMLAVGTGSQMTELVMRTLLYLPLLTAPPLLGFLWTLRSHARGLTSMILILLLLVLSFPTFLASNDAVATNTFSPSEVSFAKFLQQNYGDTEEPRIFISQIYPWFIGYYVSNTNMGRLVWFPALTSSISPTSLAGGWQNLNDYITDFRNPQATQTNVLVFTPRYADDFHSMWGTDPTTDSRWEEALSRLGEETMVYNNGFVQLYQK